MKAMTKQPAMAHNDVLFLSTGVWKEMSLKMVSGPLESHACSWSSWLEQRVLYFPSIATLSQDFQTLSGTWLPVPGQSQAGH